LLQAKDNLTFADYSYVALDADTRITEEIKPLTAIIPILAIKNSSFISSVILVSASNATYE
jgi:hypothetical protein